MSGEYAVDARGGQDAGGSEAASIAQHLARIKLEAAEQLYCANEKMKALEGHLGDAMEELEQKEVGTWGR